MSEKIQIIIADDNMNICLMLQTYLDSQEELSVVGIATNGLEAWELIQTQQVDLMILDAVMPNLDGLSLLERINAQEMMKRPKIMMVTAFGKESLTQQAMMLGVDYLILKPFDLDVLYKRILSLMQESSMTTHPQRPVITKEVSFRSEFNLFNEVTATMHQIGIPAHIKGYQFIREAILMVVDDVSLLGAVTKELYPTIAKKHNTASNTVERGIRHAIELAWERGNSDTLKRIFGYSMNIERQKPTNSEFIAQLSDKLRLLSSVS
jgi:two-component system response regulator (stage 0 sporulation protein A)